MPLIRAASFDIGKKNFAFYVEEFDDTILQKIQNVPVKDRYDAEGNPTEAFEAVLTDVCSNGTIVLYQNLDLTEGADKRKCLDQKVMVNMMENLDKFREIFDTCSIIIIEQQMAFHGAQNTMALKLGQHCMSYFLFSYRGAKAKEIVEFPAYYKTQILGAPKVPGAKGKMKSMSKPERKKWAVEKAGDILLGRGDMETLDKISKARKRDDLADVLIQLQSFKYLRFVDKKKSF